MTNFGGISTQIRAFSLYQQNVAINKSFLYINGSCPNLNYALPNGCPTTPKNFRQNGAGTWEEIDYIQTYRPQEFHPLHTHNAYNSYCQFFIPKPRP